MKCITGKEIRVRKSSLQSDKEIQPAQVDIKQKSYYFIFLKFIYKNMLTSSLQLERKSIQEGFIPYLVHTPPVSIQSSTHPLFSRHYFTCLLQSQPCIGYYEIINSRNYFPKLQEVSLLKAMNSKQYFVQFKGVWLQQQSDQTIVIYIIFQKLDTSIKQLLFFPQFNEHLFWEYLVSISKAMLFLESKKLNHGSLNLYSLLSCHKTAKLFYFPSMKTSLGLWNSSKQEDFLFLSPEEIFTYKTNSKSLNVSKSDVFNLGTILVTVLYSNRAVDSYQKECDKKLNYIESKYGFNICFILQKMTRIQAKQRIQWYEIGPYVNELYQKRKILEKELLEEQKQINTLNFRQGTFQRTFEYEKDKIKNFRKEDENTRECKPGDKKRKLIFSNKRNLLENLENEKVGKTNLMVSETNQECMMAQCYVKL